MQRHLGLPAASSSKEPKHTGRPPVGPQWMEPWGAAQNVMMMQSSVESDSSWHRLAAVSLQQSFTLPWMVGGLHDRIHLVTWLSKSLLELYQQTIWSPSLDKELCKSWAAWSGVDVDQQWEMDKDYGSDMIWFWRWAILSVPIQTSTSRDAKLFLCTVPSLNFLPSLSDVRSADSKSTYSSLATIT